MSPNTKKQRVLSKIERIVGREMPRVTYIEMSLLSIRSLEALAWWLGDVFEEKKPPLRLTTETGCPLCGGDMCPGGAKCPRAGG